MDTSFTNYQEIPFTENSLKQLHKILLNYSEKDTRHRGKYKTLNNHGEAFPEGKSLGVVFKTATPFDTPSETGHWFAGRVKHWTIRACIRC